MARTIILSVFLLATSALFAENPLGTPDPMLAGRAALTENSFIITRSIGTANFAPELALQLQLFYNSASSKTGPFGYGWSCPMLQSSALPENDGVLWSTPWGEKIRFFEKRKPEKDTLEFYAEEMKGRGFFAPYADWEADTSEKKFSESGNWIFTGKRGFKDWRFIYRDARLRRVEAPSGRALDFDYSGGEPAKVSCGKEALIELNYDNGLVRDISVGGVRFSFGMRMEKSCFFRKRSRPGHAKCRFRVYP